MPPMFRLSLPCLPAFAVLAFASPAHAQAEAVPTRLDAVAVSAERERKPIGDSTATVSVISAQEREDRGLTRMQDVTRYEPGVTVANQPARTGAAGYTIRGISDNRIRMQVDGTRLPDFPGSTRSPGLYTRDMVDFETLKQVEILRGPASALHGSDAIGGVVSYVTKDPEDYLRDGKDWGVSGRAVYDGSDNSRTLTGATAGRAGPISAMLIYSHKDGEEYKSKNESLRNPADVEGNSVLGKLVWRDGADRIAFTGEYFERDTDTSLRSDLGAAQGGVNILSSASNDETKRYRFAVEHQHTSPIGFIDRLEWRAYHTQLDREEQAAQARSTSAGLRNRLTTNSTSQRITGGEVQAQSKTGWFGVNHTLTYGLGLDRIETDRLRDRVDTNPATGATTRTFSGGPGVPAEIYPNKTFPDTSTLQGGVYVQDEIGFGAVSLVPALRLDYYRMEPSPDAAFAAGNPNNFQVREIEKFALSPKLGATWKLDQTYSLVGQYAHGFRAPPYDDANLGFTNGPSRYEVLPNPNLRPETSDGFELGLRGKFRNGSSLSLAAFYNMYSDFIENQTIGIRDGITQYQPRNVSRATIWGLEGKGDWRFAPEWGLFGGFALAKGENDDTGKPLDSVAPLTLMGGLRYTDAEERWGGELAAIHAFKHSEVSDASYFEAPSYTTVDAVAFYAPLPWLRLSLGVYNLFDESWYAYNDVTGLTKTSTVRDRYLQSGRTVTASMTVKW